MIELKGLRQLFQNGNNGPVFYNNWLLEQETASNNITGGLAMKEWVGEGKFGKIGLIERDDVVEGETLKLAAKVTWKKKDPDGKLRTDEKKNENAKKFAIKEARILAQVRHKHVIRCYGAFENDDSWIIVLEYAGGNTLLHRLNHVQRVSEESMAHYSRQIFAAVAFLHSKEVGVIHRDLKPDNFLIKGECNPFKPCTQDRLLLSDFGFATYITEVDEIKVQCGTPPYMAPEMTTKAKAETYTEKVDLWSLGVLVFEMVTAMSVYSNVHAQEIAKGTPVKFDEYNVASIITDTHVEKHVLPYCRHRIDDDGKEILQHCLKVNPDLRKSAEELQSMAEKWFEASNKVPWSGDKMKNWKKGITKIIAVKAVREKFEEKRSERSKDSRSADSKSHRGRATTDSYTSKGRTVRTKGTDGTSSKKK